MSRHKQTNFVSFTDLLFNLLVGITFLFILAFILIRPSDRTKDIESKAEFIIFLEWPDHMNSDIDLWVRDPNGQSVGFSSTTKSITTLERDDIGSAADTHIDGRGNTVYNPINREITTIRAIMEGEWAVNVHYYKAKSIPDDHISGAKDLPYTNITRLPVPVEVKVIKLNPTYKVIAQKKLILRFQGEERTITRFILKENGSIDRFIDKPINFVVKGEIGDY